VSRFAAFFNKPVDSSLRRTADGRAVVSPWPWSSGEAYVLPDAAAEQRLRSMMKQWLWTAPPVFVMFGALGGMALLQLAPLYVLTYYGCVLARVNRFSRMREEATAGQRTPRRPSTVLVEETAFRPDCQPR
jgi:hypothetical protein